MTGKDEQSVFVNKGDVIYVNVVVAKGGTQHHTVFTERYQVEENLKTGIMCFNQADAEGGRQWGGILKLWVTYTEQRSQKSLLRRMPVTPPCED